MEVVADPTQDFDDLAEGQLTMDVGGKAPTISKLTVAKKDLEVEGQFEKGTVILLEAIVDEVAFRDEVDAQSDHVTGCARRHSVRVVGVQS